MIISHRKRFGFFRIPKTASTTTEFVLRKSGAVEHDDHASPMPAYGIPEQNMDTLNPRQRKWAIHGTPQDAVDWGLLTEDQAQDYALFVFLRNPFDRYVSACAHKRQEPLDESSFESLVRSGAPTGLVLKHQADYFTVNCVEVTTPLDYRRYQTETRRLLERAGGKTLPDIPRMNQSWARDKALGYYTARTRALIRERFSEDFSVYERFFGTP